LIGPIANAVAIPLVSAVITPLALAGGALALLSPDAAAWLLVPAATLMRWLLAGLELLAALPGASVPVPRPGVAVLAATLAGCAMLLAPTGVPRRPLGALALLPLAAAPLQRPAPGELWLTALDVGQGMAVVVQVADRVLVYDTGPSAGPHSDAGARVLVPWLRGQGIARPDAVVVSHLDDDHSGGALSLLQAMPPDWLASSLPDGHRIVAAARRAVRCRRGEGWSWGDTRFDWLHPADPPERARGSPTNAVSCVLRIRSPAGSVLLPGDIGAVQERRLLAQYLDDELAADVLLAPHHGSITSSTEAFLDAVAPRWALFQVAYRSRFRHPHPRVLERYDARGIGILRSDADGAVQIRMRDGRIARIVRSRHAPPRYWRVPVPP
jgi:competence protein ComEC